jgi:hypothetical protein
MGFCFQPDQIRRATTPEELIEETEDRPRTAPLQHSELLPKREIFQDEMPAATKHASKRSEQEKEQIDLPLDEMSAEGSPASQTDCRTRSRASGRVLSHERLGGLHHRYDRAA